MGDGAIVLERPWWARILGPNPGTAILVLVVGPVSALAPAVAVQGELAAAGGLVLGGLVAAAVAAAGWRVGVAVDDEGITVQNLLRRHRIPWTGMVRMELAGVGGRGTHPHVAVYRRPGRFGRPIEISALGNVGRPRRVAWVDQVAPHLARHGVPIIVARGGDAVWNGVQAPHGSSFWPNPTGPLWRRWWDRPVTRQDRQLVAGLGGIGLLLLGAGGLAAVTGRPWSGSVGFGAVLLGVAALHIVPILVTARRRASRGEAPVQAVGVVLYL